MTDQLPAIASPAKITARARRIRCLR